MESISNGKPTLIHPKLISLFKLDRPVPDVCGIRFSCSRSPPSQHTGNTTVRYIRGTIHLPLGVLIMVVLGSLLLLLYSPCLKRVSSDEADLHETTARVLLTTEVDSTQLAIRRNCLLYNVTHSYDSVTPTSQIICSHCWCWLYSLVRSQYECVCFRAWDVVPIQSHQLFMAYIRTTSVQSRLLNLLDIPP